MGPGGLYNKSSNVNCTGGAAGYIDRLVFGEDHMYFGSPKPVYQSLAFDPEGKVSKNIHEILSYYSLLSFFIPGILSTLINVLLVYMGVHAGRIILCYQYTNERIKRWIAWTVALVCTLLFLLIP